MAQNPLFRVDNSPTRTTRPTKAVNEVRPRVPLTHNTFDNSYFNFKTQRYGNYEPFWWKVCVAGDKEPFSSSHNVRSLPFASPIESPMHLNKDYFQVPMYAIQPNTWDYIFKSPSQGDDVPFEAQNLFPLLFRTNGETPGWTIVDLLRQMINCYTRAIEDESFSLFAAFSMLMSEAFFSSGCLLFQLGYKMNPLFNISDNVITFDQLFDKFFRDFSFCVVFNLEDKQVKLRNSVDIGDESYHVVDNWSLVSMLRSFSEFVDFSLSSGLYNGSDYSAPIFIESSMNFSSEEAGDPIPSGVDCIRMDVINAYQLACSQYYVNPRVDPVYNAQLYRDNWIAQLFTFINVVDNDLPALQTFNYNGIPVLYDYFSYKYYSMFIESVVLGVLPEALSSHDSSSFYHMKLAYGLIQYLFGFREQLKFGDYFNDSRTQPLGYGEEGCDRVDVMDDSVNVIDLSSKLVLTRYRSAVAKLDNTAEDYLATMFKEQLPPDYHYPKFIVHSEFAIDGNEVSNTTSDDQGNIVTNLKSGADTAEFDITISVPSILIGISYIHIPRVYDSIKERTYMHEDRYDMFIPMLQYFGDQQIYKRELSDSFNDPTSSYAYVSRNGEFKQRLSQASGGFTGALRSWIFVDHPSTPYSLEPPRLYDHQSPIAIRAYDWEFNRFLKRQSGLSLGSGFHFIMKYNNKNVDERPMEVNPLTLYPSAI